MISKDILKLCIITIIIGQDSALSFNRPTFCPNASWNPNAVTFANNSTIGSYPSDIFISTNNTVYATSYGSNRAVVWTARNSTPIKTISSNLVSPVGLFVTTAGDIYIDADGSTGRVDKWTWNATTGVPVMYTCKQCYDLFIDNNDNLYCSMFSIHQVVTKSLHTASNALTIVAGNGSAGSASNMLRNPWGIFVDLNFDLYVADTNNNRIQLFQLGQLDAITVAGSTSLNVTITLNGPTSIVLDADGYLFIVDIWNNRVVGSGPNGFRCLVGCSYGNGSASNQLNNPVSLAFDSNGNMLITDQGNNRIQKFLLSSNSCNIIITSTMNNILTPSNTIQSNQLSTPTPSSVTSSPIVLSYNQPKLSACATWSANAITFANITLVGNYSQGIYITTNNTIYVADRQNRRIQLWANKSINPTRTIDGNFSSLLSLFVTTNGDVYIDNGSPNGRVDRWTANTNASVPVMYVQAACYGLFVDVKDTLYCSMYSEHQVISKSLSSHSNTTTIVAGTGCSGSTSNMLNRPWGIFVDLNFDLYVADYYNNRIQLFRLGQLNAITVAGNTSLNVTITLNYPTGIVLDADGYLFIVDSWNHRVVGSGPNGFRCLVGCSYGNGSASNQLYYPVSLAFDSDGNILITDQANNRIQNFVLLTNSCDLTTSKAMETTDTPTTIVTTTRQWTSTEQLTTSVMTNQSCAPPSVTLVPGASSLSSPLEFRRSQDFYIISIIQLKCNRSLSTTTQWTIKNCTTSCSYPIRTDPTIMTTFGELFIPGRTLPYGLYQFELTVTMINMPSLPILSSVYVQVTPSGITANLIQFGTSMITRGSQQDLQFNPGSYSTDPDQETFNASNWKYKYYCRIYGLSMFPNLQGSLLTIDDLRNDSFNPSCLSNRTGWKFDDSMNSSATVLSGSLQSNRTYQFMVQMENRRNSSLQATGYVLVAVEDTRPQMILIRCVIWTLCEPNLEFQRVNPTTQVALATVCSGNCTTLRNITWNIYHGAMNTSSNFTRWIPFNQTTVYLNIWFFGKNTSDFTATNQLFLSYPQFDLWRFEVVYTFASETSISSLNFAINQPPSNGSCLITPVNGTTSSLFTIICPDWFDEDGIKDYSVYGWTDDPKQTTIVAFSAVSTFGVRLPAGDNQTSLVHLIAHIRDQMNCITELNISTVIVIPDSVAMISLINDIQSSTGGNTTNPIVQLLASGNQNIVSQVLTSVSQQFSQMNERDVQKTVSNGIPAATISISSLASQSGSQPTVPYNQSALMEYNQQLNVQATVRDYLITFITKLSSATSNSIKLQASSLAQFSKATNGLTRAALMIVSERCYRLAMTLYAMRTRIPYEDAQAAATDLLQCAANLLSAVNGPLQQRTTPLDLDSSRATTFPADYDTNLESEWANPNLFSDGSDFSWETIQNNRNTYYQRQLANQIIGQMNELISLITSSLNIHLNIGQDSIVKTSQVLMILETKSPQSLSTPLTKSIGNGQIQLPQSLTSYLNNTDKVSIRSILKPLAPFGNSKVSSNTNLSRSISLSIVDDNQNEVSIRTDLSDPIEIIIPRDPHLLVPPMILQNVTSMYSTPHQLLFYLHYLNLSSSLPISVHWEIQPLNTSVAFLLIYRFDQIPQLNSSIQQIDGWTFLCPSNLTNGSTYRYFLDNQRTANHRAVIVGIRELNSTETSQGCSNTPMNSPPITGEPLNFTSNYQLRIYTSGCYYLDANNQWQGDGLRVGPLTNLHQTQCFSTHLTSFAGGFVVLPEPVDWTYVFANADFTKNKTIYLTVIVITVIYILLIIYARLYDKKDLTKLGVTPLPDNNPADDYFYQIIVFTGQRKNAGTHSNVHFVIHGDDDQTPIRTFADPHRRILQRGGMDAFLLSVPKSLGLLNCVHIWHDNTGKGSSSSWFLKYLIVRDLQTMEKFHFIARRWFAVEKEDGKIERVLPVANEMERRQFSYVLTKRTYHNISDSHLWFSIFSRPPSNQFTRVQRCTCCFVLLVISMFLNIMYYDLAKQSSSSTPVNLPFGVVYIAPQQIIIGVIVEVLALIPSLLLVQFFRRLAPHREQRSPIRQALQRIKPQLPQNDDHGKHKKMLPWWCIFLVYGLCVIFVAVSMFFIIARGIQFGDAKTGQWLISIVSGFFSSIFLTQPLKIIALAIFVACFCGKPNDDKEANELLDDHPMGLDHDEEYLHTKPRSLFTYRSRTNAIRLNDEAVQRARHQRLQEVQMWTILREIFVYVCFLSFLCLVAYSNHNRHAFGQVNHLRKYFLNPRQSELDYNKISTIHQYWSWLENTCVEKLRAQQWYNGDAPRNLSGFLDDKSNRLIGWATMRQLRVHTTSCHQQNLLSAQCRYDYNLVSEEKHSYAPGWTNETSLSYSSSIRRAFQYQSGEQLDTLKYAGRGYVYEFRGRLSDLRSNISQLHQLGWIDNQTRAVIIQLTLYNPNVELFTSVILLAEFLSSTSITLTARFEPITFHAFTSLVQLICTIGCLMIIVYFMWIEVRLFFQLKSKYFYRFWSLIDVGIIVCSWTSVGLYLWRSQEGQRIGKLFAETNGYVYINLQFASYVNNLLTVLIGFCCFFGTIKLIKLCRFQPRLCLFLHTLEHAAKELLAFSMVFSLIFMSFVCLFYLLFISKLSQCASLFGAAQMLFEMTLMKFDAHELSAAAAFLAPFCFSLFIFVVVFVCLSMFLSIIGDHFRRARDNVNGEKQEMLAFTWDRFQRWTGWTKTSEEELQEQRDFLMRSQYYGPMELFAKRIDQLLDALNRLYMTQTSVRSREEETII